MADDGTHDNNHKNDNNHHANDGFQYGLIILHNVE